MKLPSQKTIIRTIVTLIFVLTVVFLDPKGDVLKKFERNFEKSLYFESCILDTLATSTLLHVIEVSDGDTIVVSKNCAPTTVRLLGVDTPETVDPRKEVQCFGKESSDFTKKTLLGTEVTIEIDPLQDMHDKYGRLLGYVILNDGTNFNKLLIEKGYAHEYTYKKPYLYQKEFRLAQINAKQNKVGLWGDEVCGL